MATHSSILAWRFPWTEEPGGLQSTGSQRVSTTEHTLAFYSKGQMGVGVEVWRWRLWKEGGSGGRTLWWVSPCTNHHACPTMAFVTPQHIYLLNCCLSSHHTTTGRPGRCGMFPTLPEFGAGPGPWLVLSKCPIREDDLWGSWWRDSGEITTPCLRPISLRHPHCLHQRPFQEQNHTSWEGPVFSGRKPHGLATQSHSPRVAELGWPAVLVCPRWDGGGLRDAGFSVPKGGQSQTMWGVRTGTRGA